MAVRTFSDLDEKHHFWGNLDKKSQNCQFQLKFSTKPSSNMQNSMIVLTFLVLEGKYHFLANLVQKIKIVISSLNLAPRPIWIRKIWWWCLAFEFSMANTIFRQIWSKTSELSL